MRFVFLYEDIKRKTKYEECERWLNLIIKGVKKVRRGTKNIKIGI